MCGHLAKARGHRDGHFAGRLLREARSVGRELAGFWEVLGASWECLLGLTAFSACG